jgi:hypothetical protein
MRGYRGKRKEKVRGCRSQGVAEREDNKVKDTGEVVGGIRNSEVKVHKKKGKIGNYGATAEGV